MKTSLYVLIGLCIALSCTKRETISEAPVDDDDVASYAISVDSAAMFIKNYQDSATKYFKSAPIRAFTVRAEDLLEALGLPSNQKVPYTHARIYLGLDYDNQFRVFLTPVDSADIDRGVAGKDIILKGRYSARKAKKDDASGAGNSAISEGEYVMDFTGPCPNSCPSDSPLIQQ